MAQCEMSAVLFVKEARRAKRFYIEALGGSLLREDQDYAVIDWQGFHLVVHQIRSQLASSIEVSQPPERRERASLRLDYPIADVVKARAAARRLGGQIDDTPPPWAAGDTTFFLGYDPEGNVFGAKSAS
ncbi:MAG TPA: VOC family protein [Steroidobacteraceae bacterium]|nr:VOC family protein [Steroidobacteraceae bacterium]